MDEATAVAGGLDILVVGGQGGERDSGTSRLSRRNKFTWTGTKKREGDCKVVASHLINCASCT